MLAKTLKRAVVGFLIGIVIGDVIALLTVRLSSGEIMMFSKTLLDIAGGNATAAAILQSLFSGLYGAVCFAGMSFYEIDRLPLAAVTAMHCALIILTFIPIALLLGWVDGVIGILIMASVQFIVYFIIWLIIYAYCKKQVKELNELNEMYQHSNKQEGGEKTE